MPANPTSRKRLSQIGLIAIAGLFGMLLAWVLSLNPYVFENPAWLLQKPTDQTILETLPSVRNVDYRPLRSLLQRNQWEAADQETGRILFEDLRLFRVSDIRQFPCTDLVTLDRLWASVSEGRFGFSKQRQIVESDRQLPSPEEAQRDCMNNCQGSQCFQSCLAQRIRIEVSRIPEQMGRGQTIPASPPANPPEGYYPSWGVSWGNSFSTSYTYKPFAARTAQCSL